MNNPCLLSPAERLKGWREFRTTVSIFDSSWPPAEDRVVEWWSTMPFSDRSIDIYDSESWPNPWELIYHGDYCKSSISLGIAYTLMLIGFDPKDIKILLIDDQGLDIFLVVSIEDKYVLNYNYKETTKIETLTNVRYIEEFSCNDSFNFTKLTKEANETIL